MIECNAKGQPIFQDRSKRQSPRKFDKGSNEVHAEKELNELIEKSHFDEEKSRSFEWLCSVLQVSQIKIDMIVSLVKFFGHELNIAVSREFYRRRRCAFYWFEQHLNNIIEHLGSSSYSVIFDNGIERPLFSTSEAPLPYNPLPTATPMTDFQPTQSISVVEDFSFPQETFYDEQQFDFDQDQLCNPFAWDEY